MDRHLAVVLLGVGTLAAIGSVLVVLGLADVLAYVSGYRASHWVVYDYATAIVVTAAGWSFLAAAFVGAARAVLDRR